MSKERNIPEIRFPGFTDAWEQRKLSELITEYKETVDSNCTLPILTSSKTEGVVLQEEHFGNKQKHDISGYNILPRNYCTYRNRSDGVDFTFNINKCCDKGIISKFYPVFCGRNSDIFFISLVLNNDEEVIREIGYTCKGTGQKVLSFVDLQKMNIRVPSHDEQKKISAYFTQLDNLITLHQRKCDSIRQLKSSMLQKMFPKKGENVPEIRFPGFTDAWEQRKVKELCSISTGKSNTQDKVEAGEYPFYVRSPIIERSTKYLYDEEAVITVGDGVGTGKVFHYVKGKYDLHQRCYRMYDFTNELDAKYFYHTFSKLFGKRVSAMTAKTSVDSVRLEMIADMEIPCPNVKEQEKIGRYFTNLDNLITLHQRKCDVLKELKKGMLQKMFV